ncbi:hypothetical protein QFZ80_000940 [Paenibacillus sp. V4I7]|nr:hypothetical protein [Paenibacillus sp. V4I7]
MMGDMEECEGKRVVVIVVVKEVREQVGRQVVLRTTYNNFFDFFLL